ncbi:MAG: sodium-dependent transporter [Defluviicoccus sp.]
MPGSGDSQGNGRERWGSRSGFVFAAAGSTIGLGGFWRLPFLSEQHGGGAFLILFLGMIFVFGLSIFLAELAIGRAAQRSGAQAYASFGVRLWSVVGVVGVFVAFLILAAYTVVAGWVIAFALHLVLGTTSITAETPAHVLAALLADPAQPILGGGLFILVTVWIVTAGIRNGIERVNRLLVPLLLVLLLLLAARALTLPGAIGTLGRALQPGFAGLDATAVLSALGHALFSLSLGFGIMIVYGSYCAPDGSLVGKASAVLVLSTAASLMVVATVLPLVTGGDNGSAASAQTLMVVLPQALLQHSFGIVFVFIFFAAIIIGALTSAISMLEAVVAHFRDRHGFSRTQSAAAVGLYAFLLGVPLTLSIGGGPAGATMFGQRFVAAIESLSTNTLLPLGAMAAALFVGWVMGPRACVEAFPPTSAGQRWAAIWLVALRAPIPAAIAVILLAHLLA